MSEMILTKIKRYERDGCFIIEMNVNGETIYAAERAVNLGKGCLFENKHDLDASLCAGIVNKLIEMHSSRV